jgi:large subunit ribosomal protein L3
MKYILGTKIQMTQVFGADGTAYPVTAISAAPVVVTQVKTAKTDGYDAIQVGTGTRKEKNVPKAQKGHTKTLGNFRELREHRIDPAVKTFTVGEKIDLSVFKEGDVVSVIGTTKGKGFAGVVKRHGFYGGPRTHGQKDNERAPGSIGGGLRTRVPSGIRMAGRKGSDRLTTKSTKVIQINPAENIILVSGSVPGHRGSLVEIVG